MCVGFFTLAAITNDQSESVPITEEDKAAELVDYAKTLYEEQDERLKRRFPLAKPLGEKCIESELLLTTNVATAMTIF